MIYYIIYNIILYMIYIILYILYYIILYCILLYILLTEPVQPAQIRLRGLPYEASEQDRRDFADVYWANSHW